MKKIGIVIADTDEFVPFLEKTGAAGFSYKKYRACSFVSDGTEVTAVCCGIGKVNAATAAALLIADLGCDAIFNIGLSGAVQGLERGHFVVGTSFTECDFDLSPLGFAKGEKPGQKWTYEADGDLLALALSTDLVRAAKFGCGDFFLADGKKKDEYISEFGINAFDMETGAIASVCEQLSVPFLSVRKLSDNADETADGDYREMNDLRETDLSGIILEILRRLK